MIDYDSMSFVELNTRLNNTVMFAITLSKAGRMLEAKKEIEEGKKIKAAISRKEKKP